MYDTMRLTHKNTNVLTTVYLIIINNVTFQWKNEISRTFSSPHHEIHDVRLWNGCQILSYIYIYLIMLDQTWYIDFGNMAICYNWWFLECDHCSEHDILKLLMLCIVTHDQNFVIMSKTPNLFLLCQISRYNIFTI